MTEPTPPPGSPTEPLLPVASIVALTSAIVDLLVAFGLHMPDGVTAAILTLINAAAPIVVWAWGRTKTFSPATVRRMMRSRDPGA